MKNTIFKQLVTSAMGSCIKSELDRLTVPVETAAPTNYAETKLLAWLREKMMKGSIMDHTQKGMLANEIYVGGVLSMFDDSEDDDIKNTEDPQGAIVVDLDKTKPIIMGKVMLNGYLYGLAGCENSDFMTLPDGSGLLVAE